MFFVIMLGVWHSIIGSLIFTYTWDSKPSPSNYWLWVDRYVFFSLGAFYIVAHVVLIIWFIIVPMGIRRQMRLKDVKYQQIISKYSYEAQQSNKLHATEPDTHF